MKKSSRRLQTVLKLAKLRQQLAAEQLGQMIRTADVHQQQVEQLKHYQQDYGENFKTLAGKDVSAEQLGNYQRFFGSLEQAVDTQQQRTILAEDQRELARRQWQQQYSRTRNMQALITRKQQEEEWELEKKRQREQDDRRPIEPSG